MEEFIRCIQTGAKPYADGMIGLRSVEIPIAAERSIKLGRPVEIEELRAESEGLKAKGEGWRSRGVSCSAPERDP